MKRTELEALSREELVAKAESLGIVRPKTLTIPELIDEVLVATDKRSGPKQKKARGWFGRARDLLTSVIDRGLAEPTLGRPAARHTPTVKAPLPTVTLAEIYAAQGHFDRAIATLDEVLSRDPEHQEALRLRERFVEQARRTRTSAAPPGNDARPATVPPPPPLPDLGAATDHRAGRASTGAAPTTEDTRTEAAATADGATPVDSALAAPPDLLAERYDVDEVVAIAVDPHTVYVYWEVRPTTLAAARAKAPRGELTLRVVTVEAKRAEGRAAPLSTAKDVRVDALFGEVFLREVPANAQVRVTVGWRSSTGESGGLDFVPLAVGLDLATPRETPVREVARRFMRADVGELADSHDAFRAASFSGPGRSAFGRSTPEEIALGHGTPAGQDLGAFSESPFVRTSEVVLGDGRRVQIEKTTVRAGASELSRERVRVFGASENRRLERAGGASDLSRPARFGSPSRPLDVAFGARALES